jgi:hypothetical protein
MSEHEELEMSLAAWVLDAVTADEADEMRLHIEAARAAGGDCTHGAGEGALPLAVDEVTPPASVARARPHGSGGVARICRRTGASPDGASPAIENHAAAAGAALAIPTSRCGRGGPAGAAGRGGRGRPLGRTPSAAGERRGAVHDRRQPGACRRQGQRHRPQGAMGSRWWTSRACRRSLREGLRGLAHHAERRADPAAVFVPDSNGSKVVVVNQSLSGYSVMAVTREAGPSGTSAPRNNRRWPAKLA